jgi:magnesium-transporting ATPase (P-type)
MPFNYTIVLSQQTCTFTSSTYQAFYALWNLIIWSWIPTICMLIFGLLIIRRIRQGRMRVVPQNQFQRNQKKTNRQLIQMLLIQSSVFGLTSTALSIGNLYVSITNNLMVKNNLEKAKDNFLTNGLGYIALTGPCMSFYLFTLSSQLFRHELTNLACWQQAVRIVHTINTGTIQQT